MLFSTHWEPSRSGIQRRTCKRTDKYRSRRKTTILFGERMQRTNRGIIKSKINFCFFRTSVTFASPVRPSSLGLLSTFLHLSSLSVHQSPGGCTLLASHNVGHHVKRCCSHRQTSSITDTSPSDQTASTLMSTPCLSSLLTIHLRIRSSDSKGMFGPFRLHSCKTKWSARCN